ncbi:MAG: sensor domain-containing diguanylate cyclase [Amphritea sp.]|nr:sensor domain-containing diguanylate cyclase [Amphritea sp.]
MNRKFASCCTMDTPLYLYALMWLGPAAGFIVALNIEVSRINKEFAATFDRAITHISQNISTYDVALEGFANYLSLSGDVEDSEIRSYVQGIRKLYPDIYMFEISSRISRSQRDFFERSMRAKGYTDFRIHGFDYEKRQPVDQLPEREDYYPIRFIEPETEDTRSVLGLDLAYGSEVLVETILATLSSPRAIASRPFTLMEGGKGYVLYRPVALTPEQADSRYPISFAMLVVRGDTLLPLWLQEDTRLGVSLSYVSSLEGSLERSLVEPDVVAGSLDPELYSLTKTVEISSESHPFTLKMEAVVCLSDINWLNVLIFVLLGGFASRLFYLRINDSRKRRIREEQERRQLYLKANYDPLTGLPNLNLLNDLAHQTLKQAFRKGSIWGVLYLDLDQFKSINDQLGHDAGDQLLNQVAGRLRDVLREEDTAARLHGDEFVVLLPELADRQAISVVIAKVQSIFIQPFQLAGESRVLSCSIGYAVYPDDGADPEALLKVADQRMYQQKQQDIVKSLT